MPFSTLITAILSIASSASKSTSDLLSALEENTNCTTDPLTQACLGAQLIYLDRVCSPPTTNSSLDLTFPCNQQSVLRTQCTYGKTFEQVWNSTSGEWVEDIGQGWTAQSIDNQRLCACESELFDTLVGCSECYSAHGASIDLYGEEAVRSMSSSYCAAAATPTAGLEQVLKAYYNDTAKSVMSAASAKASTSAFSDPLARSTAVSYYYTASVTGTAVFDIAGITKGAEPTETSVHDGQIVSDSSAAPWTEGSVSISAAVAALVGFTVGVVMW